jgi:hypothetical protein
MPMPFGVMPFYVDGFAVRGLAISVVSPHFRMGRSRLVTGAAFSFQNLSLLGCTAS